MRSHRLVSFALAFVALASVSVQAQDYERIDVDDQGQPGNVQAEPSGDLSDDGRFVVFQSAATNFEGTDFPGTPDVFLRDRQLGSTTRVSTTLQVSDTQRVSLPIISGDAQIVVYMRGGVSPGTSPFRAFRSVRGTGVSTEVLVPGLQDIRIDALNRDGTFAAIVARTSPASLTQVYRLHVPTATIVLCSRNMDGSPSAVPSLSKASIDDEGTHVAFVSASQLLVPGDTNGVRDAFVFDIPGSVMLRASVSSDGVEGNLATDRAFIAGDGRFVAIDSSASNLIAVDTNGARDVFVRDLRLGVTSIASLTTTQEQFSNEAFMGFISGDATTVAFASSQTAPPLDTDPTIDPFVRDLEVGVLLPAGVPSPYAPEAVWPLGISRNGRDLLIGTTPISPPTGSPLKGVYVAKFGPRCSSSGYCTALPNSTGDAATIGAQGDASRQFNSLVISAVGLPDAAFAMFVSGASAIDPGTPFGNGLLCVGGTLIRHGIHVANDGVVLDAQDVSSAEYAGVRPGDTRYYQLFYRDPPAGGALFNTTDAVAVTFCW